MDSEEISKLIDRLIKENVALKEDLRAYADRLYEASEEIDLLRDRIKELEERLRNRKWLHEMDLEYYSNKMSKLKELLDD